MPTIYDNIEARLADGLRNALTGATSLDACVGYFNLRGWNQVSEAVEDLAAPEACRLLVGMSVAPNDELKTHLQAAFNGQNGSSRIDAVGAQKRVKQVLRQFHEQLVQGMPSNASEATLRRLVDQLKRKKLIIKLFVKHPLHAKLYLVHRQDLITPVVGYLGSSNLTFSGLSGNGELNVDVAEQDAARKLHRWFEERWNDRLCLDIGDELIKLIEESWAGEALISPYHVYLKMAYHLAEDARLGLQEFRIPSIFGQQLYDYQAAAVRIAARYLNQQGGVMIGDVVGLGKTMMATALARLRQEDFDDSTLIVCPPNLKEMWEWYRREYELTGHIVTTGKHGAELADLKRYRVVLIDESHNLRNTDTSLYRNIRDYIESNSARCILLSATPYNKQYEDLAAQVGLFVSADQDLGIRPEAAIRELGGEVEFARRHPVNLRTLSAFRQSDQADDWQDLMRRYLVRRTRTFIKNHYTEEDECGRRYLLAHDGTKSYFPDRVPRTVAFEMAGTPYARLVQDDVVERINRLSLPRYGLGEYVDPDAAKGAPAAQLKVIDDLGRAGVRLKGFTRTGLFKRLESSGESFLLSIRRHVLKNEIFLHALANDLPLPIGPQSMDDRLLNASELDTDVDEPDLELGGPEPVPDAFKRAAVRQYDEWMARDQAKRRNDGETHRWLPARLFRKDLAVLLASDVTLLREILEIGAGWTAASDPKLIALRDLLVTRHPHEKVLVFTQYADTARYLNGQLAPTLGDQLGAVTSGSGSATAVAHRFSPRSNKVTKALPDELRVLISTDVLSEGQNLQDAHIVVNFDLPWAIIRLIQRVGRIDRIGQEAEEILAYSFLPADGIEALIRLRDRVRQRLTENAAVVGADERFFEGDDTDDAGLVDIYNERSGVFDDDGADDDVDLASFALQIWKDATDGQPQVAKAVQRLDDVVYATKANTKTAASPHGALIYVRSGNGIDALARVDEHGAVISESPLAILRAAACGPDEPPLERAERHHEIVRQGVQRALASTAALGSGLGPSNSTRFKVYRRLTDYEKTLGTTVFGDADLKRKLPLALEHMLRSALLESARLRLARALQQRPTDEQLALMVIELFDDDRLTHPFDDDTRHEAIIKCSMGLRSGQ